MMANGFDPVAVGIPEERRVIRSVMIAQARRPVIAAAGRDSCIPERIDLGPPFRLETPMAAGRLIGLGALSDRDVHTLPIGRPRPFSLAPPPRRATDFPLP